MKGTKKEAVQERYWEFLYAVSYHCYYFCGGVIYDPKRKWGGVIFLLRMTNIL